MIVWLCSRHVRPNHRVHRPVSRHHHTHDRTRLLKAVSVTSLEDQCANNDVDVDVIMLCIQCYVLLFAVLCILVYLSYKIRTTVLFIVYKILVLLQLAAILLYLLLL